MEALFGLGRRKYLICRSDEIVGCRHRSLCRLVAKAAELKIGGKAQDLLPDHRRHFVMLISIDATSHDLPWAADETGHLSLSST